MSSLTDTRAGTLRNAALVLTLLSSTMACIACSNASSAGSNGTGAGGNTATAGHANGGASAGTGGVGMGGASAAHAGAGGAAALLDAGIAGAAGADAGQTLPPDAGSVIPKTAPFGWVGIIGTGQSLAVGGGGTQQQWPISTAASAKNLKLEDHGADPKYPISGGNPQWLAVPLSEPFRASVAGNGPGYTDGQYPNDIQGETPQTALGNTLSALFAARGGVGDYVSAHSVVGWAGHCLSDIDKQGGQRAYPASLSEARAWKQLALAAHQSYGVGAIVLTHGECDATTGGYGAGIYQLWQDYNADLAAITGQARAIPLLASQQSTQDSGATGSAVQLWQASAEHPSEVICTGPKYQYQYGPDSLHLPATGYVRLGEKYAEIVDIVVNQERAWRPLEPTKVERSGARITITFNVPNPPLVWDTVLAPPHQQKNKAWAAGKGFEVTDSANHALTITSAQIRDETVILQLAQDPGSSPVHVGYALVEDGGGSLGGQVNGLRGLLRDSDDFSGSDAEEIDTRATNGSNLLTPVNKGAFARRTGGDIAQSTSGATSVTVLTHDTDDQLTLGAPWPGPTGSVKLSYHHGQANWCVHFALDETR